jgi:hypothetical protein
MHKYAISLSEHVDFFRLISVDLNGSFRFLEVWNLRSLKCLLSAPAAASVLCQLAGNNYRINLNV